jgi:HD superfamily phosphohydrolase
MHNRPLTEQVAGLLHDVSHTVFSHVADHLFKTGNHINYQDTIHEWYLEKMNLAPLLARHNLNIEEVNPDNLEFCALEQKSPKLCADRIEYILHTALVFEKITPEELTELAKTLHFDGAHWYFSNQTHARMLADFALYFTKNFWATASNLAWRHWLCSAIKQAIARNLITSDDIHFGSDALMLSILNSSQDTYITEMMDKCYHHSDHYTQTTSDDTYDLSDHFKVRAVDPLILLEDETTPLPLSQRDSEYKKELEETKRLITQGTYICWT